MKVVKEEPINYNLDFNGNEDQKINNGEQDDADVEKQMNNNDGNDNDDDIDGNQPDEIDDGEPALGVKNHQADTHGDFEYEQETIRIQSKIEKPLIQSPAHASMQDPFLEESDSNFFAYFMSLMLICIIVYVAYHNKTKVIALVLEGRRSGSGRGTGGIGRRKHTAAYRKLDTNLEEAITSNASGRTTQIIY